LDAIVTIMTTAVTRSASRKRLWNLGGGHEAFTNRLCFRPSNRWWTSPMAQSPIHLNPAMTNRAVPDFERMIGPAVHIGLDWKGTRP
jgi:hypothetical protein